MIHKLAFLPLLLAFSLSCCREAGTGITNEDFRKLDVTADVAAEIQLKHGIECQSYWKIGKDAGQIELYVPDATFDHAALAAEISKFKSVRACPEDLHLHFVIQGTAPNTHTLTTLAKYDAKTGRQLQP